MTRTPSQSDELSPPLPLSSRVHLMHGRRPLAFLVEGSRLFAVAPDLVAAVERQDGDALRELFTAAGPARKMEGFDTSLPEPAAISLNIAQSCNLSCGYCYADEGRFGGRARLMPDEVAFAAIDRLISGASGRRVTVGFIGGEPFLNRDVLHRSVTYALEQGRKRSVDVGFSVTTNGTLLKQYDIDLLRNHAFAVSVSLDGGASVNDRHRRTRAGVSGFATVIKSIRPLLESPGKARIAARATITRESLDVADRISSLAAAGFQEIGVSPLRTSPDPALVLRNEDWGQLLDAMILAAEEEWQRLSAGASLRFSNLAMALKQIHAGAAKPLPCGAAANYVSVSAQGNYFTCHRTIDDSRHMLGSTALGLSTPAREAFVQSRHVDTQEPCRTCWARYLCGGGCHAEVLSAGRSGCDFIRGWLDYCLRFYDRLLRARAELLERKDTPWPVETR
jgi:uncharacterized protein